MEPEEGQTRTKPNTGSSDAGIDQAEAYANDPANSSRDFVGEKSGSATPTSSSQANEEGNNAASANGSSRSNLSSVLKNKTLLIGGGGTGIAILIISGLLALLPLKLEAYMKNMFQQGIGNSIEHYEEKRAQKMVVRFLLTKGGQSASAGVVADTSMLGGLYKTWRVNNFADKFANKSGISITPSKDGKGITLSAPDGVKKEFTNADEFEKFLNGGTDKTLKGVDARSFIRKVTRDQTKWYEIYKRSNLRKFMRNAYGIKKWSWFTGERGDKGATNINNSLLDEATTQFGTDAGTIIECSVAEKDCPGDNVSRATPEGPDPALNTAPSDPVADTESASLTTDTRSSVSKAVEQVKALSPTQLAEKGLSKILSRFISTKLAETISTKTLSVAGVVLFVDQLSRINHFFSTPAVDTALRSLYKVEYAKQFAEFASISDNSKDPNKNMSGSEFNAVMTRLGDPKNSAAFQHVFMGKTGGTTTLPPSLSISDTGHPISDAYNSVMAVPTSGLRAWYVVAHELKLNVLIDGINNAINGILSPLLAPLTNLPIFQQVRNAISDFVSKGLMSLLTPAVDGTAKNGDLFEQLFAGATVTGIDYAKSLGGHLMTSADVQARNHTIAVEQAQLHPGLGYQIFSTSNPSSVSNRLAAIIPRSPGELVGQSASYALATTKNPFSFVDKVINYFTRPAAASDPANLYGLQDYGYTEADLNVPIQDIPDRNHDGKVDATDCTTHDDGTPFSADEMKAFNDTNHPQICLLDVATAQDLQSIFTTADDGGLN